MWTVSSSQYRYDPTRTRTLRQRFVSDVNRRYRDLRGRIWKAVVDGDGFALRVNVGEFAGGQMSARQVESFMLWLQDQIDQGILEVYRGTPRSLSTSEHWSDIYVRSAYERGVARAHSELEKIGISITYAETVEELINLPFHVDRLALLYTRTYNELRGVTQAMSQDIARTLAEGMAQGLNPYEIARNLNKRVDAIGPVRSRMIARTEIIRAHHQANILTYREAGIEGVRVIAEWLTAGDDKVCTECLKNEGKRFSLDEAEGMIPVHPNCRCVVIPVTPETEKKNG
jgi:SPP1 gp7 family putative phage head morphogenesis protein